MIGIARSLLRTPATYADLLGLFALTVILTPLIPTAHPLARPDLAPWITAVVAVASVLRGRSLGDRPLPSLAARDWPLGRWLLLGARVSAPLALLAAFDLGRSPGPTQALAMAIAIAATGALQAIGQRHGETAWRPPSLPALPIWALRGLTSAGVAAAAGAAAAALDGEPARWLPLSAFVGLQLTWVGLIDDRVQTRAQRSAAGRRDSRPHRAPLQRYLLAAFGPSTGLLLLALLHELAIGPIGFAQAPVVALHILAWTGILFPPPTPIAVSCLLHEVVPAGGRDPGAAPGRVSPFDEPPQGALRLDPVAIRRLRVIHHWVVPVRDPRIEVLDDPTRPLWPPHPAPLAHHVLGDASFEPDAAAGQPKWAELTLRLREQHDVGQLHEHNAQQRRVVVLRPFSGIWASLRRAARTYRWDRSLPADAITIVDATTQALHLRDGDLLVLSTEGIARAYELEIGAPILDRAVFGEQRPPQLEDYVRGAG